jgi:hypothetical protein
MGYAMTRRARLVASAVAGGALGAAVPLAFANWLGYGWGMLATVLIIGLVYGAGELWFRVIRPIGVDGDE